MDFFAQLLADNPTLALIYQVVRAIAILLDIALLGLGLYAFRELWKLRPKFVYNPERWQKYVKPKKKPAELKTPVVANAWAKIQARLKDGSADALRLAIVEADGIVDEVLRRMGLHGETFADRLGRLDPEKYATLDRLWSAHRVRNNLVHTPDFRIPASEAAQAIAAYEAFLKEAKAL